MGMLKLWSVALVAAVALAACGREDATAGDAAAQSLEVYEVPPAQLQSVQRALVQVLHANDTGSVSSSDGRLLVLAPASTQASVGDAIASLAQPSADAEPVRDTPIRLRFWLLEGSSEAGPADPRLEPLKPALEAASSGLGLHGYRLQGFTEVLTTPAKGFTSSTSNLVVSGGATLSGEGVRLDINMDMKQNDDHWDAQIETNALLETGRFLVLGTSAAADGSMRVVVAQAQLAAEES